jgi:hypothetical protein
MSQIRKAIADGAFFIPLFSSQWLARTRSVANEELLIAIAQLRQRAYERSWLIPARIDACEIPRIPIGPERMLTDLHYVDLTPDNQRVGFDQLLRALNVSTPILDSVDPLGTSLRTIDESTEPEQPSSDSFTPTLAQETNRRYGRRALYIAGGAGSVGGVALGSILRRHGAAKSLGRTCASDGHGEISPNDTDPIYDELLDHEMAFAFGDSADSNEMPNDPSDDVSDDASLDDAGT